VDWKSIHWGSVVTPIVALYGAALSTYTIIAKKRESQRVVKVIMSHGIPVYGSQLGDDIVLVTATNPGNRAVRLSGVSIRLPNTKQIVLFESAGPLPHDLHEGDKFESWIGLKQLRQTLRGEQLTGKVRLIGVYRDAIGTEYISQKFELQV
jgi:hypothetical protein